MTLDEEIKKFVAGLSENLDEKGVKALEQTIEASSELRGVSNDVVLMAIEGHGSLIAGTINLLHIIEQSDLDSEDKANKRVELLARFLAIGHLCAIGQADSELGRLGQELFSSFFGGPKKGNGPVQ